VFDDHDSIVAHCCNAVKVVAASGQSARGRALALKALCAGGTLSDVVGWIMTVRRD